MSDLIGVNSFEDCIDLSLTARDTNEYSADFNITVDNKEHHVYTVSVANRDLLLYTKDDTFNYLIDLYGDRPVAVLY